MDLHLGLLQQGPGSDAQTARALGMLPALGPDARILDAGCGPGRQTLALARATGASIVAIDLMPQFLEQLEQRVEEAGLADRITARQLSMDALDYDDAAFDLIWSEGAIYSIGFEAGLRLWRRFLRPGGHAVVTEATWLVEDRPAAAVDFWAEAYPAMQDAQQNLASAERAGYAPVGHFVLPSEDWWTDYYTPIEARLPALREKYAGNPEALAQLDDCERESEIHRRYSASYGYVFYLLRRD